MDNKLRKAKTAQLILGILQAICIIGIILTPYVWIWSGFFLFIKVFLTLGFSSLLIWGMFRTVRKIIIEEEAKIKKQEEKK